MSSIRILPEVLSNKIAAGEVVQRPASVVKELVENSIDAKSKKITVEIVKGGKSLIRVSDDGMGMNKDDALLSLERYATSKIRNDSDLFSIKTLGFRGEAIPSISSVSKLSIITREHQDNIGTKIEVMAGRIQNVSDFGSPKGTILTVRDLFYNVPARRNFLKSVNIEAGHIIDVVLSLAISRPEIRFKLVHNGRITKDLLNSDDYISRISSIIGNNSAKHLFPIKSKNNDILIKGWIGNHEISRSDSKGIYFFINGRHIKSKAMQQTLTSAYRGRIVKGKYPIAIISVNLPHNRVDVNVHPAKKEVRFIDHSQICNFLYLLVKQSLQKANYSNWNFHDYTFYKVNKNLIGEGRARSNYRSEKINIDSNLSKNKEDSDYKLYTQPDLWEGIFFSYTIIGQHHNTYIICSIGENLILIDQHAAHERILFEQLKLNSRKEAPLSQRLLLTELIETSPVEVEVLEKLIPYLNDYGLEVKPFGKTTFTVKAIPALLSGDDISVLVKKLIKISFNLGFDKHKYQKNHIHETVLYECLSAISCHGAIKAGKNLTKQEMKDLVQQLGECENPSLCPHGRPIWVEFKLSELEKRFNRK